jgi:hypothetical protein
MESLFAIPGAKKTPYTPLKINKKKQNFIPSITYKLNLLHQMKNLFRLTFRNIRSCARV